VEVQVLDALVPVTPLLQALQEGFVELNLLECSVCEGHPRESQRFQLLGQEWRWLCGVGPKDMGEVDSASEADLEDANFRHPVKDVSPSVCTDGKLAADV
jgi:hypothetical protein